MNCHGCNGKGWIETAGGAMVHICPICRGSGWLAESGGSSTNSPEWEYGKADGQISKLPSPWQEGSLQGEGG